MDALSALLELGNALRHPDEGDGIELRVDIPPTGISAAFGDLSITDEDGITSDFRITVQKR